MLPVPKILWIGILIVLCSLNVNASKESKILKLNEPTKRLLIHKITANRKVIVLDVNEMDTILSVKEKIEMNENVPVQYQKLQLHTRNFNKYLEDNKSLNEYPIFEDHIKIYLTTDDLPELDPLTLQEAVEMHLEHIPLTYQVKNTIMKDNPVSNVATLVDPKTKIGENNQVTLALFFAVLTDSINVVNMLCNKYPWAAYDYIREGKICAGQHCHFERHDKKFE
jgi:hypothetical protein